MKKGRIHMIKIVEGSLLDAAEDIMAHQVNCQGVMGSGIAKSLRASYSDLFPSYKQFCNNVAPHDLLGKCHMVKTGLKYVANLFGQLNYGRQKVIYTDYEALQKALVSLKNEAQEKGLSVALPYNIGCGLANGDWDIVYKIIEDVFSDYDVTIYKI
ncbi:macro domain-containing protein [Paenibacillus sp. N3/727]|uniref:macro domain-containing protein n=1 Tax=Paenibacillus sp. N3/727 TaxID=2925845 RepID=UPI001F53BA0C|nr:macro domain-containing protein [Paenibacillus sp. N3/727]UNK20688.1 macro domain-containing protein [Paenibacillus sp. N3/727]